MEPKLLIFRVSLSPKNQLLLIYLYQLLLNNRNSAYCFNSNHLEFSLITFYNIIHDIKELIVNSENPEYSFNAYTLCLIINKTELLLNTIPTSTGRSGHELALVLCDVKDNLTTILSLLIESN